MQDKEQAVNGGISYEFATSGHVIIDAAQWTPAR
jgi:hypothetical protein